MTNYTDIAVFINETGLFARNAVITNSASIAQVNYAGNSLASPHPNGPLSTSVTIDYLTRLTKDPLLQNIISFKDNISTGNFSSAPYPFNLQIGSISGTFYLNSLSINFDPNSLISVNATLNSFEPVSTSGIPPLATSIIAENRNLSHTRTLEFTNNLNQLYQGNIYGFSYSFQNVLVPLYQLGSRVPRQVITVSANEKSSLQFDTNKEINFTGKYVNEYLDGYSNVRLSPYMRTGVLAAERINLALNEQVVTSVNTTVTLNQPMQVNIESERSF